MVAIICDRCGGIIRAGDKVGYIAWNFREGAEGGLVQDNPFEMSHFCCKCMEGFKEYIEKNKGIAEDMGLAAQQVTAAIARFKKNQGKEKGQGADGKEVGNA